MKRVNRKEFFKQSAKWGGCCGAALLVGTVPVVSAREEKEKSVFTPCDDRVKQGQEVIKRIIAKLDQKLDKATREEIMENCGRLCHDGANPERRKPTPEETARFLEGMRSYLGKEGVQQSGDETIVYFKYIQNPRGLKVSDGYCLCPILEDAPKDISGSYCHCSVGYVKAIFEQGLGKPARVELTNSVLRGGKSCDFTVRFKSI